MKPRMRKLLMLVVLLAAAPACKREEQVPGGAEKGKGQVKTIDPKGAPGAPAGDDISAPPDVAAAPADAEKKSVAWNGGTQTIASKVLQKGTGTEKPQPQDRVKVNYTGWTTDGKMFDSSVKRGQPATFALRGVIPGWTEGLQLMVVGEKRRFWIPEDLAYKDKPGRPQGTLVFDVELLEIVPGPKPIAVPEGFKADAPPADARKDKVSGLVYKITQKGDGKGSPSAEAYAEFHFTAWSSDGQMLDSTVQRQRPLNIPIDKGIPVWKDSLPNMQKGEKRLVWATEEQAFKGRPGSKPGFTLFELELVSFVEPPKAPADVKEPPSSAIRLDFDEPAGPGGKEGERIKGTIFSRVIKKGSGDKPKVDDTVEVHYTGWTTDGKMFDSSVTRGRPARFPLRGVISGWTYGVPQMQVGEKRLMWIPQDLAYKGQPGAPAGMLVFEIELLAINPPPETPPMMPVPGGAGGAATGGAAKPGAGGAAPSGKAPSGAALGGAAKPGTPVPAPAGQKPTPAPATPPTK
jgi:peptidylprolyl isomerase